MPFDLEALIARRFGENYELHERHLNRTLVTVQRTIGVDKIYARAEGAYLYDADGAAHLDFLSGYSVFNIGRNHPVVKRALQQALELDLPNMVQMDSSLLSGLLGEALVALTPAHLDAVFFCNSGTEAMEGALKFARAHTRRSGLLALEGAFHGLSLGALSLMGSPHFREGFGELLPACERVKIDDLPALERRLRKRDIAALVIEPVQGKGVKIPSPEFLRGAQSLCREHGTLFVCDEIQTGLGRTGRMFGFEHAGLEPDIVTLAKSLSGGYVPCAAIVARRAIYQSTFDKLQRCVVHSSTFGRNNLAMAAGLATLQVIDDEHLVERSARIGKLLRERLQNLASRHSAIKEVRGQGLILAIEFHEPRELSARLGWKLLHRIETELFAQMVVTTLFTRHRILTQVAAHGMDVIKILPPLIVGEEEVEKFVNALDATLTACRRFPGPLWDLGRNFLRQARRKRTG